MGKMYFGLVWILKTHMIRLISWYVADAQSVWSERDIVESSPEFHVDSRASVRVGLDVRQWFLVNVRLRYGCVMSPMLFNVYMDGVVREVNAGVLGRGLEQLRANGGRFEINQLFYRR